MPETTNQVDHKAEALRLLGEAGEESGKLDGGDHAFVEQLRAEALVHSNLAIADGQERVAEELKNLRRGLRDELQQALSEIVVAVKEGLR